MFDGSGVNKNRCACWMDANMTGNNFGVEGTKALSPALKLLTQLTEMDLYREYYNWCARKGWGCMCITLFCALRQRLLGATLLRGLHDNLRQWHRCRRCEVVVTGTGTSDSVDGAGSGW